MQQEEQSSEQPVSTTPGQGGLGVDRDSKGNRAQPLLPSFHGPSFKGQHSSSGSALQPLTADKASADRESQQELVEKLGLVRPADSFARALGPRPHRHTTKSTSSLGHSLSGAANESSERPSIPTSSSQEDTAAIAPSQTSQVSSTTTTSRKRRAAEKKPQILEISGAEAQQHLPHDRESSQVSWLRPPAGASRALQVTKDGAKDAMRQSQGLKVLLDDQTRAKEAELQQKAAPDKPDTADSAETDPVEQSADELDTSEIPSASLQQSAEAPESHDLQGTVAGRPHLEATPDSNEAPSRAQDLQHLTGEEGSTSKKSSDQGPRRWRLRAPFRHRARSAVSQGRLTEQVCRMHPFD